MCGIRDTVDIYPEPSIAACRYLARGVLIQPQPTADHYCLIVVFLLLQVFKTGNMGLSVDSADGVEVCIVLKANGACPSMQQLCHRAGDFNGCSYSVFDKGAKCCGRDFAFGQLGPFGGRR